MKKTVNLLNSDSKKYSVSNSARLISFVSAVSLATFYIVYIAAGANTTIGNNISTSGTLTVGNTALFSGTLRASSTLQATGKTTLFGNLEVGSGYLFVNSSTGAIGLGTTTADSAHLTLTGNGDEFILFGYETSSDNSGLRFKNESTGLERAALKWNESNNRWDFYVGSSGNTNDIKFQITNSGITASGTLSVLSTSASSTFANGIQLSSGCFRMPDGSCVGSGGGSGTVNNGTQGHVAFYNTTGDAVSGTSSVFIAQNNRVGIGTTNPQNILSVAGFVDITGPVGIGTTTPTAKLSVEIGTDPFAFWVGDQGTSSPSLTVTGAGNVGIGTASPNNSIQVASLINFDNSKFATFLGYQAGNVTSGSDNTFVGYQSGLNNGIGTKNTAIGKWTLFNNTSGDNNVALGYLSLVSNTSGGSNVAIGVEALQSNTNAFNNVAVGKQALSSNTTGFQNVALGTSALSGNTTGTVNTAVGYFALSNITTVHGNVALGHQAGRFIADGSSAKQFGQNSVYLGTDTKSFSSDTNNTNEIVIGYNATGLGSNSVVLGNNSVVTTALKGSVGIGTTSPSQPLSVHGNALFSGNLSLANLTATGTLNVSGLTTLGNASTTQISSTGSTYLATSGGNVGIGTTNPSEKLVIADGDIIRTNSGPPYAGSTIRMGDASKPTWRGNTVDVVGFLSDSAANSTSFNGWFGQSTGKGVLLGADDGGYLGSGGVVGGVPNLFLASDSSGSVSIVGGTTVSISGNNGILLNNTTGIGTTSPTQALSVHGNALFSGNLSLANLAATGTLTVTGTGTSTFSGGLQANALNIVSTTASSTFANGIQLSAGCFRDASGSCVGAGGGSGTVNNGTQGQVAFYDATGTAVSGTSTLFISAASKVGIGTTSPQQSLHLTKGSILQTIEANPTVTGSVTDATLLDGAFSIFVSGKFAFVAALNSNRLTIVDVSSTTPVIVSSLNDATNFNGISAVYVSGKYAYVNALTGGRFTVVDITNINTPRVVGSVVDATKLAGAQGLYVSGKYAYVTGTTNGYLNIIDISNPASPTIVGFINNTTQIGQARSVYVSGRYAYIAVENNSRLTIVDISNSTSPTIVASLNDGINLNGASVVYVSGKYAYVGLNVGTRFTIVDVSNPASPTVVSSLDNSNFNGTKAVQVAGRYAYVSNFGSNLTIVDIFNPNNPVIVGSVTDSTNLNGVRGAHVVGKYAYVAAGTGDRLTIVDLAGSEFSSANIGVINSNQLSVAENIYADNNLHVGNGLNVGSGGIFSRGPLSVHLASTTQTNPISGFFEGRVGIGTTSPSQNLSVQGTALFSNNVTMSGGQLRIPGGTVTAPGLIIGDPVSGSNQTGIFNPGGTLSFVDDNGIFRWRAAGSGFNNGMMELTTQVSGCPGTGACIHLGNVSGSGTTEVDKVGIYWAASNSLGFLTNSLERGRIDSSGNWGIGTTSPSQKLSVQGNSLFSGNLSLANLTATGTLTVQGTGTSTFANGLDISSGCFAINGTCVGGGGGGSGTVNNGTQGQVAFYDTTGTAVSGTSTIFITSAQDVGIGTTSPAEKLAIAGRLYVGGSGTSTVENNLKVLGNLQIGAGTLTLSGDSISSTNAIRFGGGINANSAPVSSSTSQMITSVVTSGYNAGGNDIHDIAIGIDGFPLIAEQENSALVVIKCGNSSCTSGNTKTTVDSSSADIGRFPSIAIGTDGLPIISYYDFTNGDLEVVKCGNISCSSGNTITTVEATGDSGRGTSIAIGADGLPVISFGYFTDFNLKVVKCGNAACSSGNTISLVDGVSGSVGLENSIAIGTDGLPIISYYAVTGDDLKVAKCNNASCSSSTLTTVDTGSGRYNRIAIAGDGLPVISYSVSSSVKMLKCGNTSCSSGNTTTEVATTPASSGARTFIAVGTDGLPIVAFGGTGNNNFRVVKCSNSTCSSNTVTIIESGTSALLGQFPKIAIGVSSLPTIAYGGDSSGVLRVVTCANTSCSSTSGTALTGGQTLGGWMATPRSYSPPFQAVNTLQIVNPTTFQNLSLLSGGAERLTITPVGRVGIGTTSPISAFSIHNPALSIQPTSTTSRAAINLVQDVTGEDPVWAQFGLNGTDANGVNMSAWIGTHVTDSFSIMTASQERMRIGSNGNVGIGTSSPMDKLSVSGGNIAVSGCVRDAELGTVHAGSCLDLAETYEVGEFTQAGEILMVNNDGKLIKATPENRYKIIGIVSTAPAVVLEGSTAYFGGSRYNATTTYNSGDKAPIALAGRVPVKVNDEGGPIQTGDPITISSISGVGKKATESGKIIGYALSVKDQNNNVLVFVSNSHWQSPTPAGQADNSSLLAQVVDVVRGWLESMKITIQDGLLKVKNLVAETFQIGTAEKPQGITIFDVDTGEPYCVVMKSGALVTTPGECLSVTNNEQQTTDNNETEDAELNGPSQAPPPPPGMSAQQEEQPENENNNQDEQADDQEQNEEQLVEENSEESSTESSDVSEE